MNEALEGISQVIGGSGFLSPVLAVLAGIISSFMPCSLSTVPLIIGYVGGRGSKKSFRLSLLFALGSAVVFTALGATVSFVGGIAGRFMRIWYIVLGLLMVLMALQTWELYNFIPASYLSSKNRRRGYAGAFISGMLAGLFSSPCSTPVLIVLLGIAAEQGNVLWGTLLLLCYSIGHGALAIILGTGTGLVKKITGNPKYGSFSKWLRIILGIVMLLIGFYMFWLGF